MYFIVKLHCVLSEYFPQIWYCSSLGDLGKSWGEAINKKIDWWINTPVQKKILREGEKKPNLEHEGPSGTILSSTSSKNWSVSYPSGSICQRIETTKSLKILRQLADFSLILPLATEVIFRKIILIFIIHLLIDLWHNFLSDGNDLSTADIFPYKLVKTQSNLYQCCLLEIKYKSHSN